jgi:hypothetical protein
VVSELEAGSSWHKADHGGSLSEIIHSSREQKREMSGFALMFIFLSMFL